MNEIRHVMLPKLDDIVYRPVKHQPWYKERLRDKYLNNNTHNNIKNKQKKPGEKFLDAKNWTFIKGGLDDFREGLPPPHDDVIIKPLDNKGTLRPTLVKKPQMLSKKALLPTIRHRRLTSSEGQNSNMMTLTQAKRERVEQLIYGLSQHPLALYSHFEESLPADLFEEIVNLLDPDMNQLVSNLTNDDGGTSQSQNDKRQSNLSVISRESSAPPPKKKDHFNKTPRSGHHSASTTHSLFSNEKKPVRNTYKWLLKKEEAKHQIKTINDIQEIKTQALDTHIKKLTEDFCGWVRSLGGDHNIDPVTLSSLFASGYETKPALSVPIHVVELANIPSELRNSMSVATVNEDDIKVVDDSDMRLPFDKKKQAARSRYGAWYLPKKLWRHLKDDEKLVDPKLLVDKDKEEAKKRSEDMNAKLAPLHGTQSFKEFIKNKHNSHQQQRVPKMIGEIENWEHEQAVRVTVSELAIRDSEKKQSNNTAIQS